MKIKPQTNNKIIKSKQASSVMRLFNMPMNYAIYNGETVFVEDARLVDDIIETIGIDFNNCIAKAFRNISYQRVGDSYMATVFLK